VAAVRKSQKIRVGRFVLYQDYRDLGDENEISGCPYLHTNNIDGALHCTCDYIEWSAAMEQRLLSK